MEIKGKCCMLINNIQKKKEFSVFLFFSIGTLMLRIFYISRVNGPFVYADEFGYWAHAAHMTGNTWAGVMNGIGWYSYGYSFILTLALLLSNEMTVVYKIAVLLNVVMCEIIYGLAYVIARRLFDELSVFQKGIIAFTATSFSSYIFYSYVTMSETLLTLLIWLVFYELISIEKNPVWWKGVMLGGTLGYLYMVHNRMLSVIVAAMFCVLLLAIYRQLGHKEVILCLVMLSLMIFLNRILKNYFINMIENSNIQEISTTMGGANSATSQLKKMISLFHFDEMKQFILNIIGQLWEVMSATYLLFGLGSVYAIGRIRNYNKERENFSLYFFPILAIFTSIGITAVFFYSYPLVETSNKIRIDTLFYGRYNECFLGIFILYGIGMLLKQGKKWKLYISVILFYIGLSGIMLVRLGEINNQYLNVVSAVGIHIFHWLGEFAVWKCVIVTLLSFTVIIGLCYMWKYSGMLLYIMCIFLIILFAMTSLHCMRICIRGENDNTARYMKLFDYLKDNTEEKEVVYICEENKMAYDVQTRLIDRIVISIPVEMIDQAVKNTYIVVKRTDAEGAITRDYDICLEWEGYWIISAE